MSTDFKKLINKSNTVDKFRDAIEKDAKSSFTKDERYWQPTVDAAGNGYAVIRFLSPSPLDGAEALPWVKLFTHGFQGPSGQWYIENSLTTLGKDDPVSEYNNKLWNSGSDANKKIARDQKRKLVYISNIYVVSDPKAPENEGKVFLYRYGKKIFDKIDEAINPKKFDEYSKKSSIDPFHFLEGAHFELKIRKHEGYRNYDKSEFDTPIALVGGDLAKLEALWNTTHSLKELVAPNQFKDYATLKQRLDKVLGIDTSGSNPTGLEKFGLDEEAVNATLKQHRASTAESVNIGDDEDPELFANLAKV